MIMQFYYLYTVHNTHTITTIETRHVHGILSLCNLIDHIAVDHHHWVIDRLFLLLKWADFSNNLTKCTSTEGVKKYALRQVWRKKVSNNSIICFFFNLNRNLLFVLFLDYWRKIYRLSEMLFICLYFCRTYCKHLFGHKVITTTNRIHQNIAF